MSGSFVLLHARRTAPPFAAAVVAVTALLAIRLAPTGGAFATALEAPSDGGAQAAWTLGLGLAALLVSLHAARTPHVWLTDEGDWIGASAARRTSLVAATLAGLAAGASMLVLVLATTTVVARGFVPGSEASGSTPSSDAPETLLERAAVAGPVRSVVLQPGEVFEQALDGVRFGDGARVRVRVGPTFGADTPTTSAAIEAGEARSQAIVARRVWLETTVRAGAAVRVENVGTGALAVLGPDPVELWRPSRAWFGGHGRVALHGALLLVTLAALAFGYGCTMGPVIAALLAGATWLGAGMLVSGTSLRHALPGSAGLAAALAAVHDGRAPALPAAACFGATGATVLVAVGLARATLRSWRQELRG